MQSPKELDRIKLTLNDEAATRQLAQDVAMGIAHGGLILLKGDLGAGKTAFARAFIRQLSKDETMEVPSPTFSIVQNYELPEGTKPNQITHCDLYRISDAGEIDELGIDEVDLDTITLVEWPERASDRLSDADLTIEFETSDDANQRQVTISGTTTWIQVISRSLSIRQFLQEGWAEGVTRTRLQGDASTRSYEYVSLAGENRILMNAPTQSDGPEIKQGKPYSQIAHLAEDVSAFVGVAQILHEQNLCVPTLHHCDLAQGLLLLEDLGSAQIIDENRQPIAERYIVSSELLASFHDHASKRETTLPDGDTYRLPNYDRQAMLIEVDLLAQWYAPRFKGGRLSATETDDFHEIWDTLIDQLETSEKRLVMRDFHSPNIIWNDGAVGNARIGLIDFQDAVIGPSAYDLASLAQDARVDVPAELETILVDKYCQARTSSDFDEDEFRRDYAIMAAQRATKILGIFVRLDERDHKPVYLKHLPRMQDYIKRSMSHPVLSAYRQWYETVMGL